MRERIIMCFLALFAAAMSYADTWYGESDTSWYNSDQREFQIMNAAQFKGLADLVNNESVTFEGCDVWLMSDIDLNNIQWLPIGYGSPNFGGPEFKGNFYGNNHVISSLYINCSELPYVWSSGIGLFGNSSGDLSDVNLYGSIQVNNDCYYSTSLYYVGGLCGEIKGTIEACTCNIDMNIEASNEFMSIGLAAGKANTILKVRASGNLSSSKSINAGIGGLCHRVEKVDQCSVDADINLWMSSSTNMTTIGGIAGYATETMNSIFKGNFKLSGQIRDCAIGGVIASASLIKNSIFAPQEVNMSISIDPSWMYGNMVGPIISPMFGDCVVENCYYTNTLNTNPQKGYEVTQDYLCNGVSLDGFSPEIWLFKDGYLPSLRSLMATYFIQSMVNNGYIGVEVKEGDSLTYIVTPDNGWEVYKFYLNDQDYTDSLIQNRYRFENIDRNYQIKVIFEKREDNSVHGIMVNKPSRISIQNNTVTVHDVNVGDEIIIVSQDGIVESTIEADSSDMTFELSKGIHIIQTGRQSFKVMN